MNFDSELESMLRGLQPEPLPADLRARMAAPPARPVRRRLLPAVALAAAAVLALLLAWPPATPSAENTPDPAPSPVTLRQQQSTLVGTRPLGVVEHEGRVWELAEREWLDEQIALCSTSPVRLQLLETRHELIYRPVEFD